MMPLKPRRHTMTYIMKNFGLFDIVWVLLMYTMILRGTRGAPRKKQRSEA